MYWWGNDLESGKKIVELYEKKIESQSTIAVGFFGASIVLFVSLLPESGAPIDFAFEWVLWISYFLFGATVLVGYIARMSLIACVPSMLNFEWGKTDASKANYDGKSVLERFMTIQVICFIGALVTIGLFFVLNFGSFVQ